jgi:hypothetical protein
MATDVRSIGAIGLLRAGLFLLIDTADESTQHARALYLFGRALCEEEEMWEGVERAVKIIGIIGGVVAMWGVYATVKDLSSKESAKRVDEWQRYIVYELIEKNPSIKFAELSRDYLSEAQKLPQPIPHEQVDDEHLHLLVLALIQSGAIVIAADGGYDVKKESDPKKEFEETSEQYLSILKQQYGVTLGREAKLNDQMNIIADIVRENNGKLTQAELKEKALNTPRIDKDLVDAAFARFIATLWVNQISEDAAGKLHFGRASR